MKKGFVYIMSNLNRTTFYIGVTNNIEKRVIEHKNSTGSIFTSKYKLYDLVYFEEFQNIKDAINRETQLKNWHQEWKINLIKTINPEMKDLFKESID
jgi:putative endonuclease